MSKVIPQVMRFERDAGSGPMVCGIDPGRSLELALSPAGEW